MTIRKREKSAIRKLFSNFGNLKRRLLVADIYGNEKYLKSFYETLSVVAKERIYIEMIEAPPFEKCLVFREI